MALKLGRGKPGAYFPDRPRAGNPAPFVIGKDTRLSGYMHRERPATAGLTSTAIEPCCFWGPVPTPRWAF